MRRYNDLLIAKSKDIQEDTMESKRHLKRLISAAAAAIMTLSCLLPMSGGTLRASAAASSFTAEQGVAWAKARAAEHWNQDVDGVAGCQCVDLIKAYYKYLGYTPAIANAYEYLTIDLPSGWTRNKTPKAGDIFAWKSGSWGHVGIVTAVHGDTVDTVETNITGSDYGYPAQTATEPISKIDVFIHPNF